MFTPPDGSASAILSRSTKSNPGLSETGVSHDWWRTWPPFAFIALALTKCHASFGADLSDRHVRSYVAQWRSWMRYREDGMLDRGSMYAMGQAGKFRDKEKMKWEKKSCVEFGCIEWEWVLSVFFFFPEKKCDSFQLNICQRVTFKSV